VVQLLPGGFDQVPQKSWLVRRSIHAASSGP
jgi:hypothetical protein